MLRSVHIKDFAIIARLELEFYANMTAITGETGAGKSIIIDALSLALGARGGQNYIRHGKDRSEISVEFDLKNKHSVVKWLNENDIELDESVCIFRRNLYKDKASKSYINDRPVSLQFLRKTAQQLIEICGQQEYLQLTRPSYRLNIINRFAGIESQLNQLKDYVNQINEIDNRITQLKKLEDDKDNQLTFLRYIYDELCQVNPSSDEYQQLDEDHVRLSHNTDIANALSSSLNLISLDDEQNVLSTLYRINELLTKAGKYQQNLLPIAELINSAALMCEEAANDLQSISQSLQFDPNLLQQIEDRLALYHQMARKHRCEAKDLANFSENLHDKIEEIENKEQQVVDLENKRKDLQKTYDDCALKISNGREKYCKQLSTKITTRMQTLNLKGGRCEIVCKRDKSRLSLQGYDDIDILISTNPGHPPEPIERVASGGELSRLSLAIQLETYNLEDSPLLVFDEVDSGISGQTADIVGNNLKELAQHTQLLCITHLPQVASKANHQLMINKLSHNNSEVKFNYLGFEDRIKELARFLSGEKITEESLANARVMLQSNH